MSEIELQSVSKFFSSNQQEIPAVGSVCFVAEDKKNTVLVGPSGCGKTTILRMIAGLELASEGIILMDGQRINECLPKDRQIAMVFQNYALYPHMTVFDNMAFGLRVQNLEKGEIKKRIHASAEMLRLTEYLERKPKTLSGGQRQRVAIGRALVRSPKAFLLDEPLSNLDAKLRAEMRVELLKLSHEMGWTMIYVTHDQMEAMTLADKMIVLKNGTVQQQGSPEEIYHSPENCFVGGFIGTPSMNLMEGEGTQDGRIKIGMQYIMLRDLRVPARKVWLGVRPEDVEVSNTPTNGETLLGAIEHVEYFGSERILYFQVDGQRLTVKETRHSYETSGKTYFLKPTKICLFDFENGMRI